MSRAPLTAPAPGAVPQASVEAIRAFIRRDFPQFPWEIERVGQVKGRMSAEIRARVDTRHLRPGNTVSGPTLMTLADSAAYIAVLAVAGIKPMAVTTSLSIDFLNKPAADQDILAVARVLKAGKRLVVCSVEMFNPGVGETPPVLAAASVTYSVPS